MAAAGMLGACGGGQAPPSDEGRTLCPSCVPLSGGETSDFGGGSVCAFQEGAIPDEVELWAELEATLAAYRGHFERSLRWQAPDAMTSAMAEQTTISGTIELGDGTQDDGTYLVGEPAECGDFVEVTARVVFETADGGVHTKTEHAALVLARKDGSSQIRARSDLSAARGTLELRIDSSQPHVGWLSTLIVANADGMSGSLTSELSYFAEPSQAEAYARGERVAGTSESQLIGTFPAE
jgi:hypothetical protein